jgi:hypothetical protein
MKTNSLLLIIVFLSLILLKLSFQSSNIFQESSNLKTQLGDNNFIIYQNVAQGNYEQSLYRAEYYNSLIHHFNIIEIHSGDWSPSTGINFYDETDTNVISFNYVQEQNRSFLSLKFFFDDEVDLDEEISITQPITSMKISWDDETIHLRAGDYYQAINLPFEIKFIALNNSSIEVINKIQLIEKND